MGCNVECRMLRGYREGLCKWSIHEKGVSHMEGLTCNQWGYEFQKGVVEWDGREEDRLGVQRGSMEWERVREGVSKGGEPYGA